MARYLSRESLYQTRKMSYKRRRFTLNTNKSGLQSIEVKLVAVDEIDEGNFSTAFRQDSVIEGRFEFSLGQVQLFVASSLVLLRWLKLLSHRMMSHWSATQ